MADSTRSFISRTTWIWALVLLAVAIVSDQASKAWARGALGDGNDRPILGELLSLRLVHNSGAAFSLGANSTWLLTVGHVTDFIAYGTWFVGNVADIWIVLGAAWLALALSREPREEGSK